MYRLLPPLLLLQLLLSPLPPVLLTNITKQKEKVTLTLMQMLLLPHCLPVVSLLTGTHCAHLPRARSWVARMMALPCPWLDRLWIRLH